MSPFQMAEKNGKKHLTWGIILLIITIVLSVLYVTTKESKLKNPTPFVSLSEHSEDYVTADFNFFDYAFAAIDAEDSDENNDRYCMWAWTTDNDMIVIEVDTALNDELLALDEKDPTLSSLLDNPMTLTGTVALMPEELIPLAKEQYALYEGDDYPPLSDDAAELKYFLNVGQASGSHTLYLGGAILTGIFTLILLYLGIQSSSAPRKARKIFREVYPDPEIEAKMAEQMDVDIPRQQIQAYGPFVFCTKSPFIMVDLRNTKRVYFLNTKQQYTNVITLQFQKNQGIGEHSMHLKGKLEEAQDDLRPLFGYIQSEYPEVEF